MADTLSHVAGPDITWDGHYLRQRCSWCGAVLIDQDLELTAVSIPEGKSEEQARADGDLTYPAWPVGSWIATAGAASWVVEPDPERPDRAPDDACMRLDPEVTR